MTNTEQVHAIVNQYPNLNLWGYGRPRSSNLTPEEWDAAREELSHPSVIAAATKAAVWIRANLEPRPKSSRRDRSTYGWKHDYEKDTGTYIPNGAFTVAALIAGMSLTFDGYNPTIHAGRRKEPHPPMVPTVMQPSD